jgi:NAD(P)-dependent dehydrogenase (short-subunit alcohol dehydrogenase family)
MIDRQFPTKEGADALREQFKAHIPLNRIGLPEEVASAALFSCLEREQLHYRHRPAG